MKDRIALIQYSDLSELDRVVSDLMELGKEVPVWLFFGEMGVGKTTLIKKVCERLGVKRIVQSPTFSIVNEYDDSVGKPVYHFDFYRLKNENEAFDIGAEEYLYSGNYCFVEWPEKIESLWPPKFFSVQMESQVDGKRSIKAKVLLATQ
ncbi:tRNA (adenosine(37)-N6)-threonylcarbamoyltransferase complex ATPase subunit type 1 TsaE [Persicitalea jodogahamensis]|uniref:tRNA threonylcarbamoyladenosine biosynthesis protein TsaE n=1 Tax=Persicitalea jodogahamensis TaxID=402147 RepID=A0A8J3DDU5_9BACT|nr:tRNA (adenosine(37)-N6)-threonylcarbamoyltransferase complex ATPase subunit type 1 TsaE [Persicitalea jodogahamensis]GHB81181.1 tRNA (adenosine(37)-N6)-threonylcarbamoyltransferase complex ATPase subunit type 1 TsaE [Persicitalea jodogahamensis]